MGNGGYRVQVTSHVGSARRILGDFEKVRVVENWTPNETVDFVAGATRVGGGADEKARIERLYLSLSLCRRTFKLKGNKKFRT